MSLVHFEGFDNQVMMPMMAPWAGQSYNASSGATTGRYGTGSSLYCNVNNGGGDRQLSFFSIQNMSDEIIVGMGFLGPDWNTATAPPAIITILDSNNAVCVRISASTSNQLIVARGGDHNTQGTILYTSPVNTMLAGNWYFFEVYVQIGDSGKVIVRLNEAEVVNLSGVDTKNGTSTTVGGMRIAWGDVDWYNINYTVDDLYIIKPNDNNGPTWFLGDIRVETLFPTAEGTTTNWTPLSGTDNALMVDEAAHDGDTTYNSTAVANNKDTLTYGNLATTNGIIHAVRYNTAARKGPGGGNRRIAPVIRHGGSDYIRPSFPLADSYNWNAQTVDEDNPATGVDWTISDVNNAEFGYQLTE